MRVQITPCTYHRMEAEVVSATKYSAVTWLYPSCAFAVHQNHHSASLKPSPPPSNSRTTVYQLRANASTPPAPMLLHATIVAPPRLHGSCSAHHRKASHGPLAGPSS